MLNWDPPSTLPDPPKEFHIRGWLCHLEIMLIIGMVELDYYTNHLPLQALLIHLNIIK